MMDSFKDLKRDIDAVQNSIGAALDVLKEETRSDMSKNWCGYMECVYNQKGYCSTGPELQFFGQISSKGKPHLVCVAASRR